MRPYCYYLFGFLLITGWFSCRPEGGSSGKTAPESATEEQPVSRAKQVVDEAIAAHGSSRVADRRIEFDFRGRHYVSDRKGGLFTYERIFTDANSGDKIRDVLTNEGFYREVNGERTELSAKDSSAYANSVNSVLYFALLPYYLNDPSVQKSYLGEVSMKGEPYDKIKITFRQEGGGKDFEDEFVYWIHQDKNTVDYLAYNYYDNGETGARFREAFSFRTIDGIRLVDYINYKPKEETLAVETFDELYEKGQMDTLSRIIIENPEVFPN